MVSRCGWQMDFVSEFRPSDTYFCKGSFPVLKADFFYRGVGWSLGAGTWLVIRN